MDTQSQGAPIAGGQTRPFSILDAGHTYQLYNVDFGSSDGEGTQVLKFLKKQRTQPGEGAPLEVTQNGVTTETVILMLMDRLHSLNDIVPSDHNVRALENLTLALGELKSRTNDRAARNVEGTDKP